MTGTYEGECQCGGCRYRVRGTVLTLFVCHCKECQRQTGSAFGMALWIKTEAEEVLSGRLGRWTRLTPSGRTMICEFCLDCGTRLFHRHADRAGMLSIKPGTLDDTSWLKPAGHIWLRSAQPWSGLEEGCFRYDANPDDFAALTSAWEAQSI
jgi:hypothetical protein